MTFSIPPAFLRCFQQAQNRFEQNEQNSFTLACELGDALARIKHKVPHGRWKTWVSDNCKFKLRRAQDFMQLAKTFDSKARISAHLKLDAALRSIRTRNTKTRTFTHERLSREALRELHDHLSFLAGNIDQTILACLAKEGVRKAHQLHRDATKLRAAISRMRNRVDDQLDGYRDPGFPPRLADALHALDLTWPCTVDEVNAAYRREVQKHRPDKGGSQPDFIRIQKTYETLTEELAAAV